MRLAFFSIIAALLVGCTTTRDPIDRLAANLASHRLWQNGFTSIMPLPANAATEDVVAKEFSRPATMPTIGYKILKIRQVHIQGSLPDLYTAVLVQTEVGKKIVLLQYQGQMPGWWVRIYDAKTSAWTGIPARPI